MAEVQGGQGKEILKASESSGLGLTRSPLTFHGPRRGSEGAPQQWAGECLYPLCPWQGQEGGQAVG